jgi:hypothetical protein
MRIPIAETLKMESERMRKYLKTCMQHNESRLPER